MPPRRLLLPALVLGCLAVAASAEARPSVSLKPSRPLPGDAILVIVTGVKQRPSGKAGDVTLDFFEARRGYQAAFAVPLDRAPGALEVKIEGIEEPAIAAVRAHVFPETAVVVEEDMANPGPEDRKRIDADNHAIRAAFREADGPPRFTGKWRRPASGKATSPFGAWRTFNADHRSQHLGLDLAARQGHRVSAVDAGRVVLVRDCFLAGRTVVLDHGAGIASAYFHLAEIAVKEGDEVPAGARLGVVGLTGRTTGPHVHLSVWVTGGFVDPAGFLRLAPRPARTPGR